MIGPARGRRAGWALASAWLCALGLVGLVTQDARARAAAGPDKAAQAPGPAGLAGLWRRVEGAIDQAVRERLPRPPVPVRVSWRQRQIGSTDLAAPLLAAVAVDLDRDGVAELAALTTREVWLFRVTAATGRRGRRVLRVVTRVALTGDPAPLRPRDPVGTLAVDSRGGRTELLVRSSELADGEALAWSQGKLVEVRRLAGFPLCPGGATQLVDGRNYFSATATRFEGQAQGGGAAADLTSSWAAGEIRAAGPLLLPEYFFSAGCRDDLVDSHGRPLDVTAVVGLDRVLHVHCRRPDGSTCPAGPATDHDYDAAGVAFDVADIDNDGSPEVLTSRGGAPGDRERVTIWSRRGTEVVKAFAVEFHAGVVAITAGDIDGDGDRDVVVVSRFAGSSLASFWTLN